MAISRNLEVKIKDDIASLNEKLYVYQNDRGIELNLKISLSKMNILATSSKESQVKNIGPMFAGATIVKPNGRVIGIEKVEIINEIIKFRIEQNLTDDFDEIGVYKVQFHLYDAFDNRLTIPHIEFEVKELIGDVDSEAIKEGVVDKTKVDFSTVQADDKVIEIFSNGRYIKTIWNTGDIISAQKLNKLEIGLENIDSKLDNVLYDNLLNIEKMPYNTDADLGISTVKDALDKLLYFDLAINFASNRNTLVEAGTELSSILFTWSYNKKVASQYFDGILINSSDRNYEYSNYLGENKIFTLKANDGNKDFSKSIGFEFIHPIFIGDVAPEVNIPTEFDVKKMNKRLVKPSNQSFTYSIENRKMCFACPSTWNIKSIYDENNFNILNSFIKHKVLISSPNGSKESYSVYVSDATSQNEFTVKFNI